jgi:WD40 repeat protein/serine/threonine protein kinase
MDPNSSAPRPPADAEKDLRTVLTPTDDRTILVGGSGDSAGGSSVVLPPENYKVGSEIARGGMGAILEAEDRKLGRKVAMKVMRLEVDASEDQRQRFIREATVLARLEHPNIVPIHELGRDAQGRLFYTMKLVHGQTLQAILNSLKTGDAVATQHYTLDRLLTIFRKVCDALSLAHARGVIHRDLKPENVMVGEFGEVLLMDWGIAKEMRNAEGGTRNEAGVEDDLSAFRLPRSELGSTLVGSIMGTPQYMSPEQADGRLDDIDQRSDVFSLGGILYAILTLRTPVEGATVDEVLQNIRAGAIRTPTEFNTVQAMARGKRARRGAIPRPEQFFPLRHCPSERVPSALAAVAMKALAVKREDRYATVAEFAADIEAYQGGYATSAEHAGFGTQLMLLVKRNKILSASVALLVALSVIFTARVVAERNRVKQALVEADKQRQIAQDSLVEADRQRRNAQESLVEQQRQTVKLTMREAMNLCEHGEVGRGLQWMVRALKVAVEIGDREQERIIRFNLGAWSHVNHELLFAWRPPPPGVMRAVAFSPDGKRLLATGFRNTAQLWEPAAGKPVGPALEHGSAVLAVAFSGDGKVMATGSRDRTARVWDVATGKPRGEPMVHMAEVFSLALNHDGSRLITGSFDEKPPAVGPHRPRRAQVWDTVSGREVCAPLRWAGRNWRGYLWPLTISPDGKTAFTGVADWDAQFWDATTGKPLGKPISTLNRTSSRWFLAGCFSPDGTKLATGSSDYALRLWDVKTQMPIGDPMFHPDYVTTLAFSPDGTEIVSGAKDQAVRIWNVATGRQAGPSLMQRDQVDFVALGPNGTTVWTGSRDGLSARDPMIRCWAVGGERPLTPPLTHAKEVWHAHFLPDGKTMITTTETDTAYWWDIATGKKTGETKVPGGGHIHASALSRDGKMLAIGTCGEWSARVGDALPANLTAGDTVLPRFIYKNVVWALAVSRDGTRVIAGGKSKDAQVFDAATAKPVGTPMKHTDEVTRVALSPDGKLALTGGDDRIARLWDAETSKPLCDPLPHDEAVRAAEFSPDGRTFVTANGPNLWFWDTATHERTGTPLQLDEYVQRATFSPDGRLIVTVGDRATIVWDAASGNHLGPPLPHAGAGYAEFSRDGSRILTCGRDKTARVWLAPRSADGPVEKIALWVDTITGAEWDGHNAIRALDSATWLRRRLQLAASGGAPLPPQITMTVPVNEKRRIDLLAFADVNLDAIEGSPAKPGQPGGSWQRTKDAVRSPGRESSRLDLPVLITGDYLLRLRFTMRDGLSAMDVPFSVGDRVATLIFGAGKRNGLEMINHLKAEADDNPTRVGEFKLDRDQPHDLLIAVKLAGDDSTITVTLDGKKFIEWTGPQTALDPELRGYRKGILGLKPWATVIDFHAWELEFIDGSTQSNAR